MTRVLAIILSMTFIVPVANAQMTREQQKQMDDAIRATTMRPGGAAPGAEVTQGGQPPVIMQPRGTGAGWQQWPQGGFMDSTQTPTVQPPRR